MFWSVLLELECITTAFCNLDLLLSYTSSSQLLFGNNVYLADSVWVSLFVVQENVIRVHSVFVQKTAGFALFHQKGMIRGRALGFLRTCKIFGIENSNDSPSLLDTMFLGNALVLNFMYKKIIWLNGAS